MATFCSRDIRYKTPFGAVATGQEITISFPVDKALRSSGVSLFYRNHFTDEIKEVELKKVKGTTGKDDWYTVKYTFKEEGVFYYRFEIYSGKNTYYVGRDEDQNAIIGEWLPEWQQTVYKAGYETPDFIKGGLIYHIFVDRFNKVGNMGDTPYRVQKEWGSDVTIVDPDGVYRANDIYGGNIKGIIKKLPYLQSLGVTVLYLSPIFMSYSNHRYDTADYLKIDPVFGSEEEFSTLIKECEKFGISIMLDGVFNHTGADSIYFNKFGHFDSLGAYQSKDSPYRRWFTFVEGKDEYDCWWGCTNVPTVRRDCKDFQDFIAGKGGVIEKWTKMGVKGWRLDVVDELSTSFVQKIRDRIKTLDNNTVVIGEVWEDASTKESYSEKRKYLLGEQLDGVMNYPYKNAILNVVKSGDIEKFKREIFTIIENYPKASLEVSMTLIGTHDTVRALNALGDTSGAEFINKADKQRFTMCQAQYDAAKKKLLLGSAIQYFLPGVPSLYYGDERGMQGFEDPLNRRCLTDDVDEEILEHYKFIGAVRQRYKEDFKKDIVIDTTDGVLTIERGKVHLYVNLSNDIKEYKKGVLQPYSFQIVKID